MMCMQGAHRYASVPSTAGVSGAGKGVGFGLLSGASRAGVSAGVVEAGGQAGWGLNGWQNTNKTAKSMITKPAKKINFFFILLYPCTEASGTLSYPKSPPPPRREPLSTVRDVGLPPINKESSLARCIFLHTGQGYSFSRFRLVHDGASSSRVWT